MNLSDHFLDQSLIPLLYIEKSSMLEMEFICNKFNLKCDDLSPGFLLTSNQRHHNYKMYFIDLFFAALSFYVKNPNILFYLLEKNLLRQELETSILGYIMPETLVESKIKNWKNEGTSFRISGFGQATLNQIGFINTINFKDIDIKSDQLNSIFNEFLSIKFNRIAK